MSDHEARSYNGYLYYPSAIPHFESGKWDAKASIAKLRSDRAKNPDEQFFVDFCEPLRSREDAIASGHGYAKQLIDGVIKGLTI